MSQDEMMVVHFVGFQDHEFPETFPYRLAELHAKLAAAAQTTPDDNCGPPKEEPRKKTLAGRVRFLLRWWYLHLVTEPILAGFEAVLGWVPRRVYKLWHTGEPVHVKSRFWAAVHGLVHVGMGCCVIKVPNRLEEWHERAMDKAYEFPQSPASIMQTVSEAIGYRMRLSVLSDAQIATMLGGLMEGKYPVGTAAWELTTQVVSRLNRTKGGPLLPTKEDGNGEEVTESKAVEGITVTPAPTTKTPEKEKELDDLTEYVPTPSYKEFVTLMQLTVGDPVSPAEPTPEKKEKQDG